MTTTDPHAPCVAAVRELTQADRDLVTLTSWMADNGYTAHELAYAIEKPAKHAGLVARAYADLETDPFTRSRVLETTCERLGITPDDVPED